MKNKCLGLLDFLHFLLRISFCLFPWMATPILSFSRRFFSSAFNERVFLGAGLGLKRLQNHCIEVSSVRVDLCLPMQVRLSLADYFQSSVFFSGLPPLCTTLIENVRQNSLFFDIGANIGLVSIALSRFLPHDSIFAFEINPDTFFELE